MLYYWIFRFLFFNFILWDRVSLHRPGCLGTHFVDRDVLELTEICCLFLEFWDHRCASPQPGDFCPFLDSRVLFWEEITRDHLYLSIFVFKHFSGQGRCKVVVPILWVSPPFQGVSNDPFIGVAWDYEKNTGIYILIHNSCKVTVTK